MRARTTIGIVRLLTAAVCLVALTHRLFWGLGSQTIAGRNFFAYLTVQSNIALMLLLIAAGVVAFRRATDPRWVTVGLALVLTWTITAGLAFALIVWQAELHGIRMYVPWSDLLIHYWLPTGTALGWIFSPGHRRVPWVVVPISLVFPLVWGGITMWRGTLIGWYPYYFLDLRQVSGFGEFAATSAIALAIFALIASILVLISRIRPLHWQGVPRRALRRARRTRPQPRPPSD